VDVLDKSEPCRCKLRHSFIVMVAIDADSLCYCKSPELPYAGFWGGHLGDQPVSEIRESDRRCGVSGASGDGNLMSFTGEYGKYEKGHVNLIPVIALSLSPALSLTCLIISYLISKTIINCCMNVLPGDGRQGEPCPGPI